MLGPLLNLPWQNVQIAVATTGLDGDREINLTTVEVIPVILKTTRNRVLTLQGEERWLDQTRVLTRAALTKNHVMWPPTADRESLLEARPVSILGEQALAGEALVEAVI